MLPRDKHLDQQRLDKENLKRLFLEAQTSLSF